MFGPPERGQSISLVTCYPARGNIPYCYNNCKLLVGDSGLGGIAVTFIFSGRPGCSIKSHPTQVCSPSPCSLYCRCRQYVWQRQKSVANKSAVFVANKSECVGNKSVANKSSPPHSMYRTEERKRERRERPAVSSSSSVSLFSPFEQQFAPGLRIVYTRRGSLSSLFCRTQENRAKS